jgi:hypothetical protein
MKNDGTVIRVDDALHARPGEGPPSSASSAKDASARAGILIFSRGRQLLHMNSRALELTGHLNQAEIGPVEDLRSAPVHELSAQIQKTLDHRSEANIWEIFELKRIIFETERKILVHGFGLAGQSSHDESRIVIVLEEVGRRQEHKAQPTRVFS